MIYELVTMGSEISLEGNENVLKTVAMHGQLYQLSSVIQSCPTLCDPMDTRLSCPSSSPGACSNSCPLSQ